MRKPWIFTGNTFNRATATSNEKMLVIAKDTDGKLFAQTSDPAINPIYTDYHPVYIIYRDICVQYEIATGTRQGQTLDLVTLLKIELVKQLPLWENKIQGVYPEGTPQEKAYFPHKRTPFLDGKYDKRIEAVEALADRLAADSSPVLTAYAPTVQSFFVLLDTARNTQVQDKGTVKILTNSREAQRKVVAKALYTVLARLMYVYHNDTAQVSSFFDLALIRTKAKDSIPATSIEVRGKVMVGGTDIPIVGATVTIGKVNEPEPEILTTDEHGRYHLRANNLQPSDEGEIKLTVSAPGFAFFAHFFNVELGNIYTVDADLIQAMLRAA